MSSPATVDRALTIDRLRRTAPVVPFLMVAAMVVGYLAANDDIVNGSLPLLVAACGVWSALAVARRHLALACVAGASVSLLVSVAIRVVGEDNSFPVFGSATMLTFSELIGLGLLAGWAVRALSPIPIVFVVGPIAAAVVAVVALRQDSRADDTVLVVFVAGLLASALVGGLLRQLDRDRVNAAELARRDERIEIARELHDLVAHHITGIVVQAQAAQLVGSTRPEATASALGSIEHAGSEALTAMRRMVGALRDDSGAESMPVAPTATWRDIAQLAERSTALGLPVHLHADGVDDLPDTVAVSVHRIVREAITNAQRHAVGATAVQVRIARRGDQVEVVVEDDGRSPSPAGPTGGFGLIGMAERAASLGGLFVAGPKPSGGWQVHARLPVGR